ncbi:MAG: hypothetical protein GY801_45780 [bacterium]|nr:hypothetical protein [bacterium]
MRKHFIWILLLVVGIASCAKAPMQDEQAEMSAPEIVTVSGKIIDLTCAVKGKAMMGTWENTGSDHVMGDGSVMKGCAQMCLLGGLPAALFQDEKIQAVLACNPAPTLSKYAGEDVEVQGFWATTVKEDGAASFVPQQVQLLGSEDAWEAVVCELLHE